MQNKTSFKNVAIRVTRVQRLETRPSSIKVVDSLIYLSRGSYFFSLSLSFHLGNRVMCVDLFVGTSHGGGGREHWGSKSVNQGRFNVNIRATGYWISCVSLSLFLCLFTLNVIVCVWTKWINCWCQVRSQLVVIVTKKSRTRAQKRRVRLKLVGKKEREMMRKGCGTGRKNLGGQCIAACVRSLPVSIQMSSRH